MSVNGDGVDRDAVLSHLERVLSSTSFRQAERSAELLRYLVGRSLNDAGDRVKEYTIGVEALGRGTDFDPRTDPIVRAEASRLRGRLERYYAAEGQSDVVVIELPKGTYVPRFHTRPMPSPSPATADEQSPHRPPLREVRSYRRPILWGALGALGILTAFGAGVWSTRSFRVAPEPMTRLDVQLQSDERIASDVETDVVIAPDGSGVVFISIDSLGVAHLRVRRFDGSPPSDLPGTAGARGPFWSPDSRWVGFWAAGQLRKVPVNGGSPVVLCDATDLLGASWGEDGTIVAALNSTNRLWRVDAASRGTPVAVVDLTAEKAAPRWPQVLAGGKYVLFTAYTDVGVDQANIEVASLDGGRLRRVLVKGGTFGRYVAPDHLTFVNQGTLYAVRFDPRRLEARGPHVPIIDSVSYSPTFGYAQISVGETGVAIYRRASSSGQLIVARVDSAGKQTPLLDSPGQWGWPALSPDGQRLVLSAVESGVAGLSMFTNLGDHPRRAWNVPGYDAPAWTHDGRHLVARGTHGIVSLSALGGDVRSLIESPRISVPGNFSSDDRRLAYAVLDSATAFDVWTAAIDETRETLRAGSPAPILRSRFYEAHPAISPDGRWLAYGSDESGSPEVYVRSLGDSVSVPVSTRTGRVPRWSRTGQRLFFTTADHRVMVVSYAIVGGRFVPGAPHQWTPIRLADTGVLTNYDLGVNDQYIVALLPARPPDAQAANHVTLIQGLPGELARKAP
jgi:serine/threonine-protein kinase